MQEHDSARTLAFHPSARPVVFFGPFRLDIADGMLIDSNDPRFTRGKWQAVGADVAFGLGALLAISATVSFLSHGPESTAGVDQRLIGFGPDISPQGGGVAAWGRF